MASYTMPTTSLPGANADYVNGLSTGVAVQGKLAYRDTNKKYADAQANAAGTCTVVGRYTESTGAANTPVRIQTKGRVTGLSGLVTGTFYVLSDSVAGAIMPTADLTSGKRVSLVGYAVSAVELQLLIENTGLVF